MLLPHRILLVMNWKEHDWHRGSVGEATLTQGGECDLCRLLDNLIQLDPMTVAIHGSIGLRGITTLTSHLSWPWAIDMRPW
jgi:hypothetical protein